MKKYNVVLEENYTSETTTFGLIEAKEEIKENTTLELKGKLYFVKGIENDEDAQHELLVLEPLEVKKVKNIIEPFKKEEKNFRKDIMDFLYSDENDLEINNQEFSIEELEDELINLGFEWCEEHQTDGISYTEYYSENHGSLSVKQKAGEETYKLFA